MGHIPYLEQIALIAVLGVAVTVVLARLRIPTVAGLLAAGALLGPFGLGVAREVHVIEVLAEVGVVLLLFTIGLEFPLRRLRTMMRQVAIGGALQVGMTGLAAIGIASALGVPVGAAIFYGFVFAMSSTAIVLRAVTARRELESPHGKFVVGTLIFQDLCVVPMVLVVPLLGGRADAGAEIAIALGKATLVVVGVLGLARFVVPRALAIVSASKSRDVFLLAVLALCIGTAWLTSLVGLSLALGAFLGGMVVADTEYGHRAMGDILPLRDAFVSAFFVSLGMLFDPAVVLAQPVLVGLLAAGFLFGKGAIATLAALLTRSPPRTAWLAGAALAQFGEFGFVLTKLALGAGVLTDDDAAPLLAGGIISMFFAPLVVHLAPQIHAGERLIAPLAKALGARDGEESPEAPPGDHVVIVGLGIAGQLAATALAALGTRYVVLELDAELARRARARRVSVQLADAVSEEALERARLRDARALVLVMNDAAAAQRVVDTARRIAPDVPILMRAHYLAEADALHELGATDVVAEEVEGGVEVLARLLRRIEHPELHIEEIVLDEGSRTVGQTPAALGVRARLIAVIHRDRLVDHPDGSLRFAAGDVLYFVGTRDELAEVAAAL